MEFSHLPLLGLCLGLKVRGTRLLSRFARQCGIRRGERGAFLRWRIGDANRGTVLLFAVKRGWPFVPLRGSMRGTENGGCFLGSGLVMHAGCLKVRGTHLPLFAFVPLHSTKTA